MTDPRGSEPQRVADQVVHRLADPVRVDVGVRPGRDIDAAGHPGGGQPGTGESGAAAEQGPDVRPLQPEAEPVLVAPGQQQQVVGEPGQPLGFRAGAADRGGQLGRAAAGPGRELEFPPQHRERVAQLVAGVGDEGALPGQRPLQPAEQVVHRAGQGGDLVPGGRHLDGRTRRRPPRSDTAATCRRSRSTGDSAARASP